MPVASAKTNGKYKPDALLIVIGMSIPKYSTPLYGQKASANTIPKSKTPQKPLLARLSIFSETEPKPGIFTQLKAPIINNPMMMSSGPSNFSPQVEKNPSK